MSSGYSSLSVVKADLGVTIIANRRKLEMKPIVIQLGQGHIGSICAINLKRAMSSCGQSTARHSSLQKKVMVNRYNYYSLE